MSEKGLTREFLAERDVRIFKMRQAGVPIAEIARRFGVTSNSVNSSIKRQLNKLSQEALLAYPEVLQMEYSIWIKVQQKYRFLKYFFSGS